MAAYATLEPDRASQHPQAEQGARCPGLRRTLREPALATGLARVLRENIVLAVLASVLLVPTLVGHRHLAQCSGNRHGFILTAAVCHARLIAARMVYELSGFKGSALFLMEIAVFACAQMWLMKTYDIQWGPPLLGIVAPLYASCTMPSSIYCACMEYHASTVRDRLLKACIQFRDQLNQREDVPSGFTARRASGSPLAELELVAAIKSATESFWGDELQNVKLLRSSQQASKQSESSQSFREQVEHTAKLIRERMEENHARVGHGRCVLILVASCTTVVRAGTLAIIAYTFHELPTFMGECSIPERQVLASSGSQLVMLLMCKLAIKLYPTARQVDMTLYAYLCVAILAKSNLYRVSSLPSFVLVNMAQLLVKISSRFLHALEPNIRAINTLWWWSVTRAITCEVPTDDMPDPALPPDELSAAQRIAATESRLMSSAEYCSHACGVLGILFWPAGTDISISNVGTKIAIGLALELVTDVASLVIDNSLGLRTESISLREHLWNEHEGSRLGCFAAPLHFLMIMSCPTAATLAAGWAK